MKLENFSHEKGTFEQSFAPEQFQFSRVPTQLYFITEPSIIGILKLEWLEGFKGYENQISMYLHVSKLDLSGGHVGHVDGLVLHPLVDAHVRTRQVEPGTIRRDTVHQTRHQNSADTGVKMHFRYFFFRLILEI